nr:MAG TPA: hypothetical protein [Caudoviricetes sp.]
MSCCKAFRHRATAVHIPCWTAPPTLRRAAASSSTTSISHISRKMQIDWKRHIVYNLPLVMRQPRIVHLLRSLLASLADLHDRAQTWRVESLRRARYDSSSIMIERMIFDEMGLEVVIDNFDAGSYDFRVRILSEQTTYDEARLRALIDKYKAADKRYLIGNGNVSYTVIYQDYTCEKTDERFSVEYTAYVCEKHDYKETVTIRLYGRNNNDGSIELYASTGGTPVASTIHITAASALSFTINEEESTSRLTIIYEEPSGGIISISPTEDSTYKYKFEPDIIWLTSTRDTSVR